MEKKVKMGWGAVRILGWVYSVLGAVFLVLGTFLGWSLSANPVGPIFLMVGTPFFVLGVIFLVICCIKRRRMEALVEAGRFVWAEVVEIGCNYNVSYHNGIHPNRLVARYTAPDGVKHLFRSQDLGIMGAADLIGKPVKVYHDENFRHYYVDAQPLLGDYVMH